MSIIDVQQAMAGHPAFAPITMSYEDGGRTEVYRMGTLSVRVKAGATPAEVREAFSSNPMNLNG